MKNKILLVIGHIIAFWLLLASIITIIESSMNSFLLLKQYLFDLELMAH